ncbi:MAG: ATP-binding protein [Chitinophagaceae bacterium]
MDISLGSEVINSYKRLSYKAWYALAEFIDNSTQAYFNNSEILDPILKEEGVHLKVEITSGVDDEGEFILIKDNSIGMSLQGLRQAIIIGKPPIDTSGRSKYGLGMKTAACWLGDYWTVTTKTIGEEIEHKIIFDVPRVASGNLDSQYTSSPVLNTNAHYTIIEIRRLNRSIRTGRTSGKIKNYLRSMYRVDIEKGGLILKWQGETLTWSTKEFIETRLLKNADGSLIKEDFKFNVGAKTVKGWAGVYEIGSRKDAGFSVIQSKRVIIGWPDSFKPELIFGEQEGGSNDLVNQRLVGELYLDGFDVSHTKDEILFENDEYDELEIKLRDKCDYLRKIALSYRKNQLVEAKVNNNDLSIAINELIAELGSNKTAEVFQNFEVPPSKLIEESNSIVQRAVMKR